jgi:hypothetical protein
MCTILGSKCTPHRPFVKWFGGAKLKRHHSDHFRITVEPVIVKRHRKTLAKRGFLQKETGHPLRYSLYQNWCPVMAKDCNFDKMHTPCP